MPHLVSNEHLVIEVHVWLRVNTSQNVSSTNGLKFLGFTTNLMNRRRIKFLSLLSQ